MATPLPEEHQRIILPSTSSAMCIQMTTRIADGVAERTIGVKNESSWKPSAGAGERIPAPVVYLSDSDGTPLRSRAPARRPTEGRAAVAKVSSTFWKQKANPEVFVLDSDSDEDFTLKATCEPSVKLEEPKLPSTQVSSRGKVDSQILEPSGKVDKFRGSVSQGEMLERAISSDEAGMESFNLSGMVDIPRESVPEERILGKELSLDSATMVDLPSCETDVQGALKLVTAIVADLPKRFEEDFRRAGPSTTLGPLAAKSNGKQESNEGLCSDYLQTDYWSDKLVDSSAEIPKAFAPAVEGIRNCLLGTGQACASEEENRMRAPVQPAIHDLSSDDDGCNSDPEWLRRDDKHISTKGSWISGGHSPRSCKDGRRPGHFQPNLGGNGELGDHSAGQNRPLRNLSGLECHENGLDPKRSSLAQPAILDLSSDDDACGSEPSWLRDYEPVPIRGSLNIGMSSAGELRGQRSREQFWSTSAVSSEVGDHSESRRRPSVQIPGLESPENYETPISPSVVDLESAEDASKKKRGRARISEDELAVREAEKQRVRDLKKLRQEEEKRAREEKREELKRQKEASKVDAAERRRLEKESDKWRKGKFALQNTIVRLDFAVVEMNPLGSQLLQQLGAKKYSYKVEANPIKQTIMWTMKRPSGDSQVDTEALGSQADVTNSQVSNSQLSLEDVEMEYVVVAFQGEEFAKLVAEKGHKAHLSTIRKQYPTHSICYLISGLKKYLHKNEQHQYKTGDQRWTRPNVEQVLAEFITHHEGVNFRLCIDESEIADHVVGLTRSLAECPFKKQLTSISVYANGELVRKGDPNNHIIRKSTWMKFLVAIEGVSGAVAIAVEKKYKTMRALLKAYLDPDIPVCDKENLLQDLEKDCRDRVRVGPVLSKRIYRVLMATDGNLTTKEVDEGADFFT